MKFTTDGLTQTDLTEIKKMHTDTLLDLYMITFDPIQKMLLEEIFSLRDISIPMFPDEPPKQYA